MSADMPQVLFVCTRNAGRSQMAAAFLEELSGGRVSVRSAGTMPADDVHPEVREAMLEVGIDLGGRTPTKLLDETVRESDVVITMGCGDACPVYPGRRYEDWDLGDPGGKPIEEVRAIRDEIEQRVRALLREMEDPEEP